MTGTIIEWNKSSTHCMRASRVNMFMRIVGQYLVRAGFTYSSTCGLLIYQTLLGWQYC